MARLAKIHTPLLTEPMKGTVSSIAPSERAGVGLTWDEDAVAHYRSD
jgi:hypothetical protein